MHWCCSWPHGEKWCCGWPWVLCTHATTQPGHAPATAGRLGAGRVGAAHPMEGHMTWCQQGQCHSGQLVVICLCPHQLYPAELDAPAASRPGLAQLAHVASWHTSHTCAQCVTRCWPRAHTPHGDHKQCLLSQRPSMHSLVPKEAHACHNLCHTRCAPQSAVHTPQPQPAASLMGMQWCHPSRHTAAHTNWLCLHACCS